MCYLDIELIIPVIAGLWVPLITRPELPELHVDKSVRLSSDKGFAAQRSPALSLLLFADASIAMVFMA